MDKNILAVRVVMIYFKCPYCKMDGELKEKDLLRWTTEPSAECQKCDKIFKLNVL